MTYVGHYLGERRQGWTTPRTLFDGLHAEYAFDLDGAADDTDHLLPDFSSIRGPRPWAGRRVFCNPPWSSIAPFVELAATAELAVLLVPARTNARWFHRALELGAQVRYFLGKPRFGNAPWNSPVDCVLLVFGETP
jgi:site-specific DNA-methyltransferase (adenine-specific)